MRTKESMRRNIAVEKPIYPDMTEKEERCNVPTQA
jgi:hypothetical protein